MFAKEEWGLRPKEFANLIGEFDSGPGGIAGVYHPEADALH
jgi:hypothetical protein